MEMKECYEDVIDWLSKHEHNRVIVKVKSDKELKQYQKHFKKEIAHNLFLESEIYENIEWRIDP